LLPADVVLYDLRHTSATLLIWADIVATVVSQRVGHNSITLTLDTSSHVLLTMQKWAASGASLYERMPERS
jgi:integrase